ncbi:hypothetical protein EH203_21065 [Pectobacterium carotovorum subsp. carotovorum]|uniref:hypothetical protein n=1 Tax=Pectobacterium carotovorum TaxID=554 RepID=UPI0013746B37|nr:hypothetical protein [Pectobacterium carotovorum]QHP56091.1 hypothetical protein EH203_21065 [Pectobacterium carotovorum subsp. carotovorum]
MLVINKNNVEYRKSIYIGRSKDGDIMKMRIDKLTIVGDIKDNENKNNFIDAIKKMKPNSKNFFTISNIFIKKKHPYRRSLIFRNKRKEKNMLLRIDFLPLRKNTGFIRLEFRPQHLSHSQFDELLTWLNINTEKVLLKILKKSWITQLDIALDIYNKKLKDNVWGLKNASSYKKFEKPQGLPGLRIGSHTSKLHFLCYEKLDLVGRNFKINDDLIAIENKKIDSFLRIEARIRPNEKPNKIYHNTIFLKDIANIKNPFIGLKTYSPSLICKLEEYSINISSPSLRIASQEQFLQKDRLLRISRNNQRLIQEYEVSLFDKSLVWNKWCKCQQHLGDVLNGLCYPLSC